MQPRRPALPRKSDADSQHEYYASTVNNQRKPSIGSSTSRLSDQTAAHLKNDPKPKARASQENDGIRPHIKPQNSLRVSTASFKLVNDSLQASYSRGPSRQDTVVKKADIQRITNRLPVALTARDSNQADDIEILYC